METIKKGDRVVVDDATEPMVASRDEYNQRVWVMTRTDYDRQASGEIKRGHEEPYLVAPDRSLIRDYQHGFPD